MEIDETAYKSEHAYRTALEGIKCLVKETKKLLDLRRKEKMRLKHAAAQEAKLEKARRRMERSLKRQADTYEGPVVSKQHIADRKAGVFKTPQLELRAVEMILDQTNLCQADRHWANQRKRNLLKRIELDRSSTELYNTQIKESENE